MVLNMDANVFSPGRPGGDRGAVLRDGSTSTRSHRGVRHICGHQQRSAHTHTHTHSQITSSLVSGHSSLSVCLVVMEKLQESQVVIGPDPNPNSVVTEWSHCVDLFIIFD